MEFIKSNKGSEKLCFNGFAYTKKNKSKSTIRWECCKRGSLKCSGALVTDIAVTEIKSEKEHSHPSDQFEVESMKVRAEIKAKVGHNKHSNPNTVVSETMKNYPVQVRAACGDKETLKRTVRREKRKNVPKEPSSIHNIPHPLPVEYQTTGSAHESQFLVYDNGSETGRLLIFGSETGLQVLSDSETWFMDGTFDTAPNQFTQLFVIRASLGESYVTTVYGFLSSKQQSTYEEFLVGVLDAYLSKNLRPNPVKVVCDFELGIHNAVKSVLGETVQVQGCFYHLTQSTWRKIQSEGIQGAYLADEEIRHSCGMIDGLAFLPLPDVSAGLAHLKLTIPECLEPVLDYFDSTYVSGSYRSVRGDNGLLRFRKTPPRFPPVTWNIHEVTLNDECRTNNVCEGWNHGFKTLVGHSNPSLWFVINCIQKDNCDVETVHEQHRIGLPPKRRKTKKSVNQQKRLKTLCTQYANEDKTLIEFLESIGNCIRLH